MSEATAAARQVTSCRRLIADMAASRSNRGVFIHPHNETRMLGIYPYDFVCLIGRNMTGELVQVNLQSHRVYTFLEELARAGVGDAVELDGISYRFVECKWSRIVAIQAAIPDLVANRGSFGGQQPRRWPVIEVLHLGLVVTCELDHMIRRILMNGQSS